MGIFRWIRERFFPVSTIDGDGTYGIDVIGESYYQKNLSRLAGGRLPEGHFKTTKAVLICEDDNPKDRQAVLVTIDGEAVGYLPKPIARKYRAQLQAKGYPKIKTSCGAVITGGCYRGKNVSGSFNVKLDLPSLVSEKRVKKQLKSRKKETAESLLPAESIGVAEMAPDNLPTIDILEDKPMPVLAVAPEMKGVFVAVDVETANSEVSSICQIGLAKFEDGTLVDEWSVLIDPETAFSKTNIKIHGITEDDVQGALKFADVYETLCKWLNSNIVASHMPFDNRALNGAVEKYGLPPFECQWIDTAQVVRNAWDEYSQKGYGLANICNVIGYEFAHHNALEDAKACGHVLLAAIDKTGKPVNEWLKKERKVRRAVEYAPKISMDGNPAGKLAGEIIVFTGDLTMSRAEAAKLGASAGCTVRAGVTKKTTILVLGDQDLSRLAKGSVKSSKHKKAEELMASGQSIRIIGESEFKELVS